MKVRNILILVIICILISPFIVNLLLSFRTPITFGDGWHGFFGSYIGSIVGGLTAFFIAFYQIEKQKKFDKEKELKENRSYILAEEFIAPYGLSNTKHKDFSRIIVNDYYKEFKSYFSKAELNSMSIPYYKISHRGTPEIILDCKVEFKLAEDEEYTKPYQINSQIGIFEKEIDIFIPLVKGKDGTVYLKSVKIDYYTIKGEKMQYILDIDKQEERHFLITKENKKNTLFNFKVTSSNWILPNSRT